ncbi:MAG: hypothetical protein QG573_533, partial [Acidobacteriota bacterium]|nr:hypothetical protein [Acidobacteriota bacterium]
MPRASTHWPPVVIALLAAGCYLVDEPLEYACSAAEPQCPEGTVCNGPRCRIPTCQSFEGEWVCDQLVPGYPTVASCGARKITCTMRSPLDPWLCTCQRPDGKVSDCGTQATVLE